MSSSIASVDPNFGNRNGPGWNENDTALASLAEPAGTLWVADMEADGSLNTAYRFIGNNIRFAPGSGGARRMIPSPSGAGGAIIDRHLDTTNVLFCDGHVKALKLDAIARANNTDPFNVNRYPMLSVESD